MGTPADPDLLALKALGFLAGEPDALARFLAQSGASPDELRARTDDPHFLGGVLDYLLSDDALAQRFCAEVSIAPQVLHLARHRLSQNRAG
jgi:hypothetical protein